MPTGALSANTSITMSMKGEGFRVLIRFDPAGLQFNETCILKVRVKTDAVHELDMDRIGGYYITEDGAEPITSTINVKQAGRGDNGWIIVTMYIDGFSIYSPWDDDPEADNRY